MKRETPTPKPWWDAYVLRRENGRFYNNIHNAILILGEDELFKGILAYRLGRSGWRDLPMPKGALTNRYVHDQKSVDGGYVVTLRLGLGVEQGWTEDMLDAWTPGGAITSEELAWIQAELQRLGLSKIGRATTRWAVLHVALQNRLPPENSGP